MPRSDPGSDDAGAEDVTSYLQAYVDDLVGGPISSGSVERAFRAVPRHLFVPSTFYVGADDGYATIEYDVRHPEPEQLKLIYADRALVIRLEDGRPTSSSSQPGLVAQMLELLDPRAGMRVLEIGTGSGYDAALLAEIVGAQGLVATVDNQPPVVHHARAALERAGYPGVRSVLGDGFIGVPEAAPYDRVIVTVGCSDLSPHWVAQLARGGRILLPLRHAGTNPLLLVEGRDEGVVGRFVGWSGFMQIRGEMYDDAYWTPARLPATHSSQALPLWPGLGPPRERSDFWYFVGLNDRRASLAHWSPPIHVLVDTETGSAVRLEEDRVLLTGDRRLLEEVRRLHEEWLTLGSPRIGDYTVSFVPAGAAVPAVGQRQWQTTGPHYTRTVSLERPRTPPARP